MAEPGMKHITAPDIMAAKGTRKLAMLTAYDFPTAQALDRAGVDMLLVGDSLAMVVLGHADTLSLTLDEMIHHCAAVSRANTRAMVIGDLPFGSYQESPAQAVRSAARMVGLGRVQAVKMEGAGVVDQARAVVRAGVPVMGHVGLTPQFMHVFGGFKVQGKTAVAARRLLEEALALQDAGCFAIVIEGVPSRVAQEVTAALNIPTIGIGAGPHCDGQVLVMHDIAGLYEGMRPKFVKKYADLGQQLTAAGAAYVEEVRAGIFPQESHAYAMDPHEEAAFVRSCKE